MNLDPFLFRMVFGGTGLEPSEIITSIQINDLVEKKSACFWTTFFSGSCNLKASYVILKPCWKAPILVDEHRWLSCISKISLSPG